jgi:hypothetical protein
MWAGASPAMKLGTAGGRPVSEASSLLGWLEQPYQQHHRGQFRRHEASETQTVRGAVRLSGFRQIAKNPGLPCIMSDDST